MSRLVLGVFTLLLTLLYVKGQATSGMSSMGMGNPAALAQLLSSMGSGSSSSSGGSGIASSGLAGALGSGMGASSGAGMRGLGRLLGGGGRGMQSMLFANQVGWDNYLDFMFCRRLIPGRWGMIMCMNRYL